MCPKCNSQLEMSYKSLNDSPTKFYMESRQIYINDKKSIHKISKELYDIATEFIEQKKIFEITECLECKEVIDVNDTSEYVKLMTKMVEVATMEDIEKKSKKQKEKEDFKNGTLTVGRSRSGKIIKTYEEAPAEGHIDNKHKEKQKRVISEEVRQQRRERMQKMWADKKAKAGIEPIKEAI